MRALVKTSGGPGVALAEVDEPRPRLGEAVVEVEAFSLNRGEVKRLAGQREGFVPGWDVAGVVAAPAADGSGPPAGARIVGLVTSGAWAERAAIATDRLAELPADVSASVAATLPVAGLTAYHALGVGGALLGRRVAVTGASGGVGRFAVQLASAGGAHVTAVAREGERARGLDAAGADEVVVELESEGPRFHTILESVGGPSLAAALQRVAREGTVVTFGDTSGEPVTFPAAAFYGPAAGARVYAFAIFEELARRRSAGADLRALAEMAAAGRLEPEIGREVSWRETADAASALLRREIVGKAVVHVD